MKKFVFTVCTFLLILVFFTNCNKDKVPPKAKLLGYGGIPIVGVTPVDNMTRVDTVVLLNSKYEDPGVRVEDNKTLTQNISVSSDIDLQIPNYSKNNGYVKRTGVYEINYTITDEAGNFTSLKRIIRVANPSEVICPFNDNSNSTATSFTLIERTTSATTIPIPPSANVNFSTDVAIPGGIRLNKAFFYKENGNDVYVPLTAHLYSVDNALFSSNYSVSAGYIGKPSDYLLPFYDNMQSELGNHFVTFKEVFDMLSVSGSPRRIGNLKVEPKQNIDGTNGKKYSIAIDETNPLCPIEYLGQGQSAQEVIKITLYYKITELSSGTINRVKEVFEKRYTEDI